MSGVPRDAPHTELDRARDAILAAHNAIVRPLRRKLDPLSRRNLRAALDELNTTLEWLAQARSR